MSNQDQPDWDWVLTLEIDYLPRDVQKLVRHIGVLLYLYSFSVQGGEELWGKIRIQALENRVKKMEIKLKDLQRTDTTTIAELLSSLVLSAGLSTGLGLVVSGIAAGTATLVRSARAWHEAIKKTIPKDTLYADAKNSLKFMKDLDWEVGRSKRAIEDKAFIKMLDKKLEISKQSKGIAVDLFAPIVKGEVTTLKDRDRKPSKDILGMKPISVIIDQHWKGLLKISRTTKADLNYLLKIYKDFHKWGILDDMFANEEFKDIHMPPMPKLFKSVMGLLPASLPELSEVINLIENGTSLDGEKSSDIQEGLIGLATNQLRHVFVFQLSSKILRPEVIMSSVEFEGHTRHGHGTEGSLAISRNGELQYPYRANSRQILHRVIWKDDEFKGYITALLSMLNEPIDYTHTYLIHAGKIVKVGDKFKIVKILKPDHQFISMDIYHIVLKPAEEGEAYLEYAFLLYCESLIRNMTNNWTSSLGDVYVSVVSNILRNILRKFNLI